MLSSSEFQSFSYKESLVSIPIGDKTTYAKSTRIDII